MFKRIFFIIVSFFLTLFVANGQEIRGENHIFSLNDCMNYAVENNTTVKKQDITNDNYRLDRNRAVAALFPSVGASVGTGASFGRSIDAETNVPTTIGNFSNSYSASASMTIFDGFANINTLRVSKVMRLMGAEQLKQIKDDVALAAMRAFFDVVYYSNSVEIVMEQLGTSNELLQKNQKLLELGLKSAADVAQIESQVASDDLLLTQQQNTLELAMLTLKEKMNYPIEQELNVYTAISIEKIMAIYTPLEVLDYAMNNHHSILVSQYRLQQSQLNYRISKGSMAPSISISGNFGSDYFKKLNNTGGIPPLSFGTQLKNNQGYSFGASLSIPIFSGLYRRTNMLRSRNMMKIAEQDNLEVERTIHREVQTAVVEMNGYGKEYVGATKKVKATQLAYDVEVRRFEQGLTNSVELQTTANNLLRAKSEQLSARLQYIIRCRLVDYYGGEPLIK